MDLSAKTKKHKGFSFIEVMLSVFLISVGLISVMGLVSASLRNSIDSRDQTVASLLAEEGVEVMRNIRDNNCLEKCGYGTSFNNIPVNNTNCIVDSGTTSMSASDCDKSLADETLYYSSAGLYNKGKFGTSTKFKRRIDINSPSSGEIVVTSMVSWGSLDLTAATINTCTTANRCAYTAVTLTSWEETP